MAKNFLSSPIVMVREKEHKLTHEVHQGAPCEWSKARGATHTLLCPAEKRVGGWGKRAAILKKTRLHVATDETETGDIKWEVWEVTHTAGWEY